MKLKSIIENLFREAESKTVTFPKQNFSAYFDEEQKKIVLSPLKQDKESTDVRSTVQLIKQSFNIQSAKKRERGIVEISIDPTENFSLVKDFLIQQMEKESQ